MLNDQTHIFFWLNNDWLIHGYLCGFLSEQPVQEQMIKHIQLLQHVGNSFHMCDTWLITSRFHQQKPYEK